MPTDFPAGRDAFINPDGAQGDTLGTPAVNPAMPRHSVQHTNLNDAVSAIQVFLIEVNGDRKVPNLVGGLVPVEELGSGVADNTKFLRGDGSWQVVAAGAAALDDLTDVTIAAVADEQFLVFDSGTGQWRNRALLAADIPAEFLTQAEGDARYWQLTTDLATQAELDTHKTSGDHDGRYWQLTTDLATQAELDAHLNDAADAHDASAISVVPAGGIAANTVQAALEELDSEKAASGHTHSLDNLSDVDLTGAIDGEVLKRVAGVWQAETDLTGGGSGALDDLTDVTITAVADEQFLVFDSGAGVWRNRAILAADIPAHSHVKGDLPAAVAYEDEANTFTEAQTINGGTTAKDRLNLGADCAIYRVSADQLRTEDEFTIVRTNGTDAAFNSRRTGDAARRFDFNIDGKLSWGDGAGAFDVELSRTAANKLETPDTFEAADVFGDVICVEFFFSGDLTVQTGKGRWYAKHGPYTILGVTASVNTQPTGASVLVDVNKDATTVFTTQGNRATIAVSTNTDDSGVPDVTALANGSYLSADIDQIGSTIAGADLTVQVWLRRTG